MNGEIMNDLKGTYYLVVGGVMFYDDSLEQYHTNSSKTYFFMNEKNKEFLEQKFFEDMCKEMHPDEEYDLEWFEEENYSLRIYGIFKSKKPIELERLEEVKL